MLKLHKFYEVFLKAQNNQNIIELDPIVNLIFVSFKKTIITLKIIELFLSCKAAFFLKKKTPYFI